MALGWYSNVTSHRCKPRSVPFNSLLGYKTYLVYIADSVIHRTHLGKALMNYLGVFTYDQCKYLYSGANSLNITNQASGSSFHVLLRNIKQKCFVLLLPQVNVSVPHEAPT